MTEINKNNIPNHIAIIMDGNGRWAQNRNKKRLQGHEKAKDTVKSIVLYASKLGVRYLSLFVFSRENWNRPEYEVLGLMSLLSNTIDNSIQSLHENEICLSFLGSESKIPNDLYKKIIDSRNLTKNNKGLKLLLALNYSGRWDITNAVNQLIKRHKDLSLGFNNQITESMFSNFLSTKDIPEPELLIRTGGEKRISNFMLWQMAYTELYFTSTLWPDFDSNEMDKAILDFQKRERRFGMTSEQISERI